MKLSDNFEALTIGRISQFISQARSAGAGTTDEVRFTRHRATEEGGDAGWTAEIDFTPRGSRVDEAED